MNRDPQLGKVKKYKFHYRNGPELHSGCSWVVHMVMFWLWKCCHLGSVIITLKVLLWGKYCLCKCVVVLLMYKCCCLAISSVTLCGGCWTIVVLAVWLLRKSCPCSHIFFWCICIKFCHCWVDMRAHEGWGVRGAGHNPPPPLPSVPSSLLPSRSCYVFLPTLHKVLLFLPMLALDWVCSQMCLTHPPNLDPTVRRGEAWQGGGRWGVDCWAGDPRRWESWQGSSWLLFKLVANTLHIQLIITIGPLDSHLTLRTNVAQVLLPMISSKVMDYQECVVT